MKLEEYRHNEKLFREVESRLWTVRMYYVHSAPEHKEWGVKWCKDVEDLIRKARLCHYASLSWEDSMTVDQENKPKEALGRGAFGATCTGD